MRDLALCWARRSASLCALPHSGHCFCLLGTLEVKAVVSLPGFVWCSFLSVVTGALCLKHSRMELVALRPRLEGRIPQVILPGVWEDDGMIGSVVWLKQFGISFWTFVEVNTGLFSIHLAMASLALKYPVMGSRGRVSLVCVWLTFPSFLCAVMLPCLQMAATCPALLSQPHSRSGGAKSVHKILPHFSARETLAHLVYLLYDCRSVVFMPVAD